MIHSITLATGLLLGISVLSYFRVTSEAAWIPRREATLWNGACSLVLLGG